MQLYEGLTDTVRRLSISLYICSQKNISQEQYITQKHNFIPVNKWSGHKRRNTSALQAFQTLNGSVQTINSVNSNCGWTLTISQYSKTSRIGMASTHCPKHWRMFGCCKILGGKKKPTENHEASLTKKWSTIWPVRSLPVWVTLL